MSVLQSLCYLLVGRMISGCVRVKLTLFCQLTIVKVLFSLQPQQTVPEISSVFFLRSWKIVFTRTFLFLFIVVSLSSNSFFVLYNLTFMSFVFMHDLPELLSHYLISIVSCFGC